MIKKILFIRDDDVYNTDANFMNIFEFCLKQEISLVYGVIPNKITPALIKLLNKEKSKFPHLFDIVQHGWRHKNYNSGVINKYEFGPLRNYEQQKRDIRKGLFRMINAFGRNFTPAFIPPYHGYDKTTLRIIDELHYPIFSADKINFRENKRFIELPAIISLNEFSKKGKPLLTDVTSTLRKITRFINSSNKILGIVFHHHMLKNASQLKDMQKTLLFLKGLSHEGYIRIVLFSHILRKKGLR